MTLPKGRLAVASKLPRHCPSPTTSTPTPPSQSRLTPSPLAVDHRLVTTGVTLQPRALLPNVRPWKSTHWYACCLVFEGVVTDWMHCRLISVSGVRPLLTA